MGKLITDVGVDLDGVLYPFVDEFSRYCCERMGRLFLPEPTHWNFYEDWGLDQETFDQWIADASNSHEVFATASPYENAKTAWLLMKEMGLRLHILTARPQVSWAQTAEWLERHGFVADSLHFNPTKGFLKSISRGQALIIDDHVAYYEEAESLGIIPVLMSHPWNKKKQPANRVSNLMDLVDFIKDYNDKQKEEALNKFTVKVKYEQTPPSPYIYPKKKTYPYNENPPYDWKPE